MTEKSIESYFCRRDPSLVQRIMWSLTETWTWLYKGADLLPRLVLRYLAF